MQSKDRETKILTNAYNLQMVILAIAYFQNLYFEDNLPEFSSIEQLKLPHLTATT